MSQLSSTTSALSSPNACLWLTHLTSLPYMLVPCPTHPYTFSVFSTFLAKLPLFRAILNSCSCLLLVRLVVVWEPSSFILSHSEPMGTEVYFCISLQLAI
jgi:hypothetical protein